MRVHSQWKHSQVNELLYIIFVYSVSIFIHSTYSALCLLFSDDIASSEVVVEEKKKDLAVATLQLQEKTVDIDSLLVAAEEVGLKSKAEEIEGDISKLMADLDMGENMIRETESSSEVLGDYQEETKKSREQLQK